MGLEKLISTLIAADFKTCTLKPSGKDGVEVVQKTFWQGHNVEVYEFNEALDNLLTLVRSNSRDFERKISPTTLFTLADKLFEESKSIRPSEANDAQEKIAKIVSELLKMNHSEGSTSAGGSRSTFEWSRSSFKDSTGTSDVSVVRKSANNDDKKTEQEYLLASDSITEEDDFFLVNDVLGINTNFIKNLQANKNNLEMDTTCREKIEAILRKHPHISSIHIQGNHPIPSREFSEILQERELPLAIFLTPIYFAGDAAEVKQLLQPALILKSGYIKTHLEFAERNLRGLDLRLSDFSHDILSQINAHANDFSKLEINELNLMDLYRAADYLQISTLKARCDEFISEIEKIQVSRLQNEELWELAIGLASNLAPLTSDALSSLISKALAGSEDIESFTARLKVLKDNGIDLPFLDLSDQLMITDDYVKEIVKYLPNLTSLSLSGRKLTDAIGSGLAKLAQLQSLNLSTWDLTDAIGPELAKLSRLKSLDLAFCHQLTDAIGPDLARLRHLQSLNLSGCVITDAIVPELAKLTQLQSLNLSRCTLLTDAIVPELAKLTQLQSLNLERCQKLADAIVGVAKC